MTPDPNKQIERGDWVRFRNLPADCQPTPILVTLVLRNGMIRLLDRSGYYAAHLFMVTNPPKKLLSAADLDAVADEQRAKDRTGRKA